MLQKKKKHHKKNYSKLKRWVSAGIIAVLLGGFFWTTVHTENLFHQSAMMKQPEGGGLVQNESVAINNGQSFVDDKAADGNAVAKTPEKEGIEQNHTDIILVNKEHPLPEDYFVPLTLLENEEQVASIMYEDLCNMLSDGEEQERGTSFLVASGYRTEEKQQNLVEEEIDKNVWYGMSYDEALEDAFLTVAPAGYSEHETGLAVDIVAVTNQRMDETQEDTRENQWLQENCYKYGFILRYPKGKEEITGFSYESWHFRYVGIAAATEITEKGITLEEYLEE